MPVIFLITWHQQPAESWLDYYEDDDCESAVNLANTHSSDLIEYKTVPKPLFGGSKRMLVYKTPFSSSFTYFRSPETSGAFEFAVRSQCGEVERSFCPLCYITSSPHHAAQSLNSSRTIFKRPCMLGLPVSGTAPLVCAPGWPFAG